MLDVSFVKDFISVLKNVQKMYLNIFIKEENRYRINILSFAAYNNYLVMLMLMLKKTDDEFGKMCYKFLNILLQRTNKYANELYIDEEFYKLAVLKDIIEFENIVFYLEEKFVNNKEIFITTFTSMGCIVNASIYIECLGRREKILIGNFLMAHKRKELKIICDFGMGIEELILIPNNNFNNYFITNNGYNCESIEDLEFWDDRNWNFDAFDNYFNEVF